MDVTRLRNTVRPGRSDLPARQGRVRIDRGSAYERMARTGIPRRRRTKIVPRPCLPHGSGCNRVPCSIPLRLGRRGYSRTNESYPMEWESQAESFGNLRLLLVSLGVVHQLHFASYELSPTK